MSTGIWLRNLAFDLFQSIWLFFVWGRAIIGLRGLRMIQWTWPVDVLWHPTYGSNDPNVNITIYFQAITYIIKIFFFKNKYLNIADLKTTFSHFNSIKSITNAVRKYREEQIFKLAPYLLLALSY